MKLFVRALGISTLMTLAVASHAEVVVIINAGATVTPSKSDVANIFLGKDKSLKGVDQKDWSPTKDEFYRSVTSKNESQLKSYWSSLVFTGKGQLLPSVADDAAVVAKVGAEPDAIGYVDKAAVTDKVRVLFTLP